MGHTEWLAQKLRRLGKTDLFKSVVPTHSIWGQFWTSRRVHLSGSRRPPEQMLRLSFLFMAQLGSTDPCKSRLSRGGLVMTRFKCSICGYVYDEEKGEKSQDISSDTPFEDLPSDWLCPGCKSPQYNFEEAEG